MIDDNAIRLDLQEALVIQLRNVKFAACMTCGDEALHHWKGDPHQDLQVFVTQELLGAASRLAATWYCPGTEARTLSWPRDWWQAFKLRFAPPWFTRRWPVEYGHAEVRAMFPELPLGSGRVFDVRIQP